MQLAPLECCKLWWKRLEPSCEHLQLKCDELLSSFGFMFNLRPDTTEASEASEAAASETTEVASEHSTTPRVTNLSKVPSWILRSANSAILWSLRAGAYMPGRNPVLVMYAEASLSISVVHFSRLEYVLCVEYIG